MEIGFQPAEGHVAYHSHLGEAPSSAFVSLGKKSLSKIGSALGTPLVTNECTANQLRVLYAHILMEIDITQTLATEITIRDTEGGNETTS